MDWCSESDCQKQVELWFVWLPPKGHSWSLNIFTRQLCGMTLVGVTGVALHRVQSQNYQTISEECLDQIQEKNQEWMSFRQEFRISGKSRCGVFVHVSLCYERKHKSEKALPSMQMIQVAKKSD